MVKPRRLLAILAAMLLVAVSAIAQLIRLTILHTNDIHSHLRPFSYPDAAAAGQELQGLRIFKDIGGVARRATLVKRIREDLASRQTPVWLVDAGDYSEGTPFSMEYHGEADVAAMNAMHYDMAGDLITLDPFNNTVVLFKASGRQIREILQRYTPAVSGIRYRTQARQLVDVSLGGRPLEDDRIYSGATNSYFAAYALKGIDQKDTGKPRIDAVIAYIRSKGIVKPAFDGRRVVTAQ